MSHEEIRLPILCSECKAETMHEILLGGIKNRAMPRPDDYRWYRGRVEGAGVGAFQYDADGNEVDLPITKISDEDRQERRAKIHFENDQKHGHQRIWKI